MTGFEISLLRVIRGSSDITIEFNLDKNLEEAANDVRDKSLEPLRDLPDDADAPPVVSKADADSGSIISMTVRKQYSEIR